MCAILDANVVHEVFGDSPSASGAAFLDWIEGGNGKLAVGGKLTRELSSAGTTKFTRWLRQARLATRVIVIGESRIARNIEILDEKDLCESNDRHVIAVAQISGARLLYSNDKSLQRDFKNKKLIDKPRGKIYETSRDENFPDKHQQLLRTAVCRPAPATA